ncbi:hypothetical protein C0992_008275, partial [Termitomyces sp. T32_za158]
MDDSLDNPSITQIEDGIDNEPDPDGDDGSMLAPAFCEAAPLRLLYLQSVIGNVFGSRTVVESTQQLLDGLDLIEL